jgi:hypothetical protein
MPVLGPSRAFGVPGLAVDTPLTTMVLGGLALSFDIAARRRQSFAYLHSVKWTGPYFAVAVPIRPIRDQARGVT